jgi:hypothetical protein
MIRTKHASVSVGKVIKVLKIVGADGKCRYCG